MNCADGAPARLVTRTTEMTSEMTSLFTKKIYIH